ncbi:unnamed protein product [marine sediment metagenome]|uniref:Uncharacterized protein n=1 Tax=marine sediment metagenome TaxID=412755 RepID=X1RI04_9ZZZZ
MTNRKIKEEIISLLIDHVRIVYSIISDMGVYYTTWAEDFEASKKSLEKKKSKMQLSEEEEDKLLEDEEIEKAMLTVNLKDKNRRKKQNLKKSNKKRRKSKTLQEKAERFASIIVSLVNGCAPLFGGIVPLIPFFFTIKAGFNVFIFSFLIIFICIVLLGIFVGFVSRESLWKNVFQMIIAFGLTIIVSILLLG